MCHQFPLTPQKYSTLPPPSLSLLFSPLLLPAGAPVAILYRISFSLLFVSLLCSLMHVQLPLYRLSVDPAASRSHAAVCSERYAISDRKRISSVSKFVPRFTTRVQAIIFSNNIFPRQSFPRERKKERKQRRNETSDYCSQRKKETDRFDTGRGWKWLFVEQYQR